MMNSGRIEDKKILEDLMAMVSLSLYPTHYINITDREHYQPTRKTAENQSPLVPARGSQGRI